MHQNAGLHKESRDKLVWVANQRLAAGADAVMLEWVARGAQDVDASTGAVTVQDALLCMSNLLHVSTGASIGVTSRCARVCLLCAYGCSLTHTYAGVETGSGGKQSSNGSC